MITLKLTQWEMMVLRAALEKYNKPGTPATHRETARKILLLSRVQDHKAGAAIAKATGEA